MFKEFLNLNRGKIIFGLKWSSIIFTTIVLIAFSCSGEFPVWSLFFTVLFCTSIVLPLFTMALGTLKDYLEFRRINNILDSYPYKELTKNGFRRIPTNQNSKWLFSQIMLRGYFENYPMDCEVENGILKMIALVNRDDFKKEHMKELKRQFGNSKIEYEWLGIALKYNVKNEGVIAYGQLKTDLERLVRFLKKEGLKAWDKPWG